MQRPQRRLATLDHLGCPARSRLHRRARDADPTPAIPPGHHPAKRHRCEVDFRRCCHRPPCDAFIDHHRPVDAARVSEGNHHGKRKAHRWHVGTDRRGGRRDRRRQYARSGVGRAVRFRQGFVVWWVVAVEFVAGIPARRRLISRHKECVVGSERRPQSSSAVRRMRPAAVLVARTPAQGPVLCVGSNDGCLTPSTSTSSTGRAGTPATPETPGTLRRQSGGASSRPGPGSTSAKTSLNPAMVNTAGHRLHDARAVLTGPAFYRRGVVIRVNHAIGCCDPRRCSQRRRCLPPLPQRRWCRPRPRSSPRPADPVSRLCRL